MRSTDPAPDGDALELFAEWLSRRERGEHVDFAELVRAHPQFESMFEELQATWKRLSAAGDASISSLSLHERIKSRFGAESLPDVSLREGEKGKAEPDLATALIAQLSAQGKNFSRYQIRGEVARGGMGAILKIWDDELRRHLAMKVILGQAEAHASGTTPPISSAKVARFLEEAQVTGQLDHPGIVPVHELGLDPAGRLYFTMKLVKGESLHAIFEHVREGRDDWTRTRALSVLLKVCEAMAYAHDKGVIHRDLKPANVMVGKFGEVHVMDWGLARIEGQKDRKDIRIREDHPRTTELKGVRADKRGETPESPLYTMDGDVVGTPAYMPPEQAAGKVDEVGPHSDVYALGAMLYHLIAGHPPYLAHGVRLNNYAVWARVQEGPPRRIEELAPDVPPELVAICERAMARDWKRRYRDMSELAEDLSAYLNQRVVHAFEAGAWAEARKWVQRNRSLAAALAAALLLLLAGLTVSLVFKAQADDKARLAQAAETRAKAEKANVLKLSAFQTLEDLTAEAEGLWPADPALVERYLAWMKQAEHLVAMLPDFRASLVEIEQRALPQSAEERAQERASHPRAKELEAKLAELGWMRRMLGEEPWPSVADVASELSKETLPADAHDLNALAWALLIPSKPVYGSELKGLLLAQRAFDAAGAPERPGIRRSLAWAYFRLGRFDEALAELNRALEEAGSTRQKEFRDHLEDLRNAIDRWRDPQSHAAGQDDTARSARVKDREKLSQDAAALDVQLSTRRNWRFAEAAGGAESGDRWWHEQLLKLITALESFQDPNTGLLRGVSEVHGWGVGRRLAFASSVEERTVNGAEARKRWSEAILAIAASPKYGGLKLTPQLGLLPIGADPHSQLWEFAYLQTGEPATRGADGNLLLSEAMSVVFVLIPAGTFWMGAQKTDPNGRNYDPEARDDEAPVHEVALSPYFLSKYEMTQGQWSRFAGKNPSQYRKDNYSSSWNRAGKNGSELHPVEQVSWKNCMEEMGRLGCELPTEAQWENGCRGGTSSVYWTGDGLEGLGEAANISDAYAHGHGGGGFNTWEKGVDDGNTSHAEVGSYRPNAFGLHDVHGNVWEWCRDGYDNYKAGKQVDPVVPGNGASFCMNRGGGFSFPASGARSAHRFNDMPELQDCVIGLRPARAVRP